MKFWAAEEAFNYVTVPREVADLVDITREVMSISGDERTRFVRIGQNDGALEDDRFQVDLKLAPGIILPTMLGSVEGVGDGWDDLDDDEDRLADMLQEGLEACLPILDELGDTLHDARLRARRVVAAWNSAGIPTRLIDVRLAQYDHWRGSNEPALFVTVETLDDALEPVGLDVALETRAKLEDELEAWRHRVGAPYARRSILASKGASGTIDQLALNVLAYFGDMREGVRRLVTKQRLKFLDGTAIVTMNGHVSVGNDGGTDHLDVAGHNITVASTFVSAEQLRQAVGRPVSELIDYEFLSDDITVAEAACTITDGKAVLSIEINNPARLFCSVSGRVWDDVERDGTTDIHTRNDAVVIPFRARIA